MMKLTNAKISILIGRDQTTIELIDGAASTTFAEVTLTPEQLSSALSRMAYTPCEIKVFKLDRVGKKMEHQPFSFELPEGGQWGSKDAEHLTILAISALADAGMDEWIPDGGFNSQGTFYNEGGKRYARTTIRRYVPIS